MLEGIIKEVFINLWNEASSTVISFVTLSFLDPFWGWAVYGGLSIAALAAVAWFFGGLSARLRAVCGAFILLILGALAVYRKGENDAREFDKRKKRKK